MISSKELNALGIPNHTRIMPPAMKAVNVALSQGADATVMCDNIRKLALDPESMVGDTLLGGIAQALIEVFPNGTVFIPRADPAPWQQWGNVHVEDSAVKQMENACLLPCTVRGALMPDAHTGYGLPIGGVLAVKDAIIPFAVGVDIACRMRLTVLDMPLSKLTSRREDFIAAIEKETRFGVGACFERRYTRDNPVMDEDWSICPVTRSNKDKAWKQLGSSGGGNHFVEFGELHLEKPAQMGGQHMEKGVYLALLSHSGSRGTGEAVAEFYSRRAKELRPNLPQAIKNLAWLDLTGGDGQEYWAAMELMGRYAAANHELIHSHLLQTLGTEPLTHVENHHNFAWREEHDGETVIVHRKGATPAGLGVQGIVPGSMGTSGFVVQGKGNEASLNSCSHGAGRLMSRAAAFREFNKENVRTYLEERGVELISGGLDEAPMAYKDIHAVMAAQSDLVESLARFEPCLVKMAPGDGGTPDWKKKKDKKREMQQSASEEDIQ
jgi:tRNA-splicing ligase RtcB